jgi:acyl carrier protein
VDSVGLVELAAWIDQETDSQLDLTDVDLATEWDSVEAIARFVETHTERRDG